MVEFHFVETSSELEDANTLFLFVPNGMKSNQELFEFLAKGLDFPDYFGWNWDALDECLRDLSWLSQKVIILSHEDMPVLSFEQDSRVYLEVLLHAVWHWQADTLKDLYVVFRPKDRTRIIQLLSQG